MKYALISDVHGNLPALLAVLRDAGERGADRYLLLGDYTIDLPWTNEVVDVLRTLPNAVLVRGNKEDYLSALERQDRAEWVYEQYAAMVWAYRELTIDNRAYLTSLAVSAAVAAPGGQRIYLSHASPVFYRQPRMASFHSGNYLTEIFASPFTHGEYLAAARKAVLENADAMADIENLPDGVHAFGHNHLQWHMEVSGKLFVNPGSCGLPLDFDPRAAYTLLEWTHDGWRVEERRVSYDIGGTANALAASTLFKQAEIWSRIVIKELHVAGDYMPDFLRHVRAVAGGDQAADPVSDAVWREAAATFPLMDIFAEIDTEK